MPIMNETPNFPPLTDSDPMPYGEHQGVPMDNVPASYFRFLWNNGLCRRTSPEPLSDREQVANYILENLAALQSEDSDGIWENPLPRAKKAAKDPVSGIGVISEPSGGAKTPSRSTREPKKRKSLPFRPAEEDGDFPTAAEKASGEWGFNDPRHKVGLEWFSGEGSEGSYVAGFQFLGADFHFLILPFEGKPGRYRVRVVCPPGLNMELGGFPDIQDGAGFETLEAAQVHAHSSLEEEADKILRMIWRRLPNEH